MVDSRAKGARGEREAAAKLTEWTGFPWRRGISQSRFGGSEGADVEPSEPDELWSRFHVEVKRGKRIALAKAWEQATRDAESRALLPLVLYRADRQPWEVATSVNVFAELLDLEGQYIVIEAGTELVRMHAEDFFGVFRRIYEAS